MTTRLRLAALTLALAACGKSSKTTPGLLLNEPSGVAVFRGYTTKTADLHPYLAIANAATNDLTIVDAVDDVGVPSPVALRTLVYPVPGRPALLASADLGDGKADLLVAVSAGDSKLQVIRTWTAEGVIDADVDLGGDVLALAALPFDPDSVGTVRVAAALSGERLAVVTFARAGDGIVVSGAPAVASLGFQPVALAATPDDPDAPGLQTSLWAATRDDLGGGVHGVVGIDVSGSPPWLLQVMNARAPTRLVAAARLRERIDATIDPVAATTLSPAAFANQPMVERVYAILDESGCGLHAPIACGLVALDPDPATSALALDPTPAGSMHAPFRAPIPIPGAALGLAAAQPPAVSPPELDPTYAGTFMRMVTAAGTRITTAAAAVASTDGFVYFVDLGRWEIPGEQVVQPTATLVAATDPQAVATNVRVTPGYTPTARWTATWQGELPGLASRRAQSGAVAGVVPLVPWLALQVPTDGGFSEVARVYDPALGVHAGDFAVIGDLAVIEDPTAIGSCAPRFEATVDVLLSRTGHEAEYPGGALQLGKIAAHPEWDACVDGLAAGKKDLRATIRSSGWVLVRGTGADAALVGRPEVGTELAVQWESEDALSCPAWPPVTSCDATCRSDCERLVRARLARRIGYVPSLGDPQGPALAFMLALRAGVITPTRGFAVAIDTAEGRVPFRVLPPGVTAVAPGDIAVFDRSRDVPSAGVRFLVPYLSNVVLDATPTLQGGDAKALH
jgi:hypothetical protein